MSTRYNPDIHHRRSIRLRDYDYSQAGAYVVTICVQDRECLFGEVVNGEMRLNYYGQIVEAYWNAIPKHNANIVLDTFQFMPNHMHGILFIVPNDDGFTIRDVGANNRQRNLCATDQPLSAGYSPLQRDGQDSVPPKGTMSGSLGAIIQNYKKVSTRKINRMRGLQGVHVWQRGFFEHVLRDEEELESAREYIALNPMRWEEDGNHPANR